eukprot:366053-Chlamydomonas_euryale.AAC.1
MRAQAKQLCGQLCAWCGVGNAGSERLLPLGHRATTHADEGASVPEPAGCHCHDCEVRRGRGERTIPTAPRALQLDGAQQTFFARSGLVRSFPFERGQAGGRGLLPKKSSFERPWQQGRVYLVLWRVSPGRSPDVGLGPGDASQVGHRIHTRPHLHTCPRTHLLQDGGRARLLPRVGRQHHESGAAERDPHGLVRVHEVAAGHQEG